MKKGQFSKLIVTVVLILNILFTVAVLCVFWHTGTEPSSLILSWFGFTTGELSLTAFVKTKKIKGEYTDGNKIDS